MKVVIVGAGSVGRYMAQQLRADHHEIVVLDQDRNVVARAASAQPEITWLDGDGCELDVLARCGTQGADVVAAVTGDDEDNLVISLLAKQQFGVPRVVARVNNPNNEWMFNEMWGVDVSVSTPHLLTAMVEEAVSVGSFVRLLSLDQGRARLSEVTLADTSPAVGRTVAELGMPRESSIVAILRRSVALVPRGDTLLQAGDEVLVLLTGDAEGDVRELLVG